MVDGGGINGKFGYTLSKDAIHWTKATYINLEPEVKKWWKLMRTPLGLISEGGDEYTLFFTAITDPNADHHDDLIKSKTGYGALGAVRLKLKSAQIINEALKVKK